MSAAATDAKPVPEEVVATMEEEEKEPLPRLRKNTMLPWLAATMSTKLSAVNCEDGHAACRKAQNENKPQTPRSVTPLWGKEPSQGT